MKIRSFAIKSNKKITESNKDAESRLIRNHQVPKISKISWEDAYKIVLAAKISEFLDLDFINIKKSDFELKILDFLKKKQKILKEEGHGNNDSIFLETKEKMRDAFDLFKMLKEENNFSKIQKACEKNKVFNLDFLIKNLQTYQKILTNEPRVTNENKMISLRSLLRIHQNGIVGHIKTISEMKKNAEKQEKNILNSVLTTINEFEKKYYPEDLKILPKQNRKEKLVPHSIFDEEIKNLFQ
jgi:hypothetical protein